MVERIDQMFLMLAQELGGITQIFEGLFSFLKRRTDFFVLANPGDKVGFPPGVAEQIIFSIYKKYRDEYNKEHPFTPRETPEPTPDTPKVEEISESSEEPKQETEQKPSHPADVRMEEEEKEPVKTQPRPADPERVEISAFNGAKTDKYTWNQSVYDVDVQIKLPPGTRSRDLKIVIEPKRVFAALKSDLANPLIQGELFERIKAEKSSWILDENKYYASALLAFIIWGFFSMALKPLHEYPSLDILFYRVFFSTTFLLVINFAFRINLLKNSLE